MWKSRGFTLSSSWVSKLRTLFLRLSSAALWRKSPFRYLYPRPRTCGHYPELMSIGEGQSTDQVVNRELCLPSSVNLPRHASLTCEQDPYVHAWGWTYLPNGSGLRTKAKMYLLYWSLIFFFFEKRLYMNTYSWRLCKHFSLKLHSIHLKFNCQIYTFSFFFASCLCVLPVFPGSAYPLFQHTTVHSHWTLSWCLWRKTERIVWSCKDLKVSSVVVFLTSL